MTLYYMHGDEFKNEVVVVNLRKTPKQAIITPISPKPRFTYGCIDQLWDKGEIVIRDPKPPRVCRHHLEDWGNGNYTLYPNRAGLPYLLTLKETE